MHSPDWNPNKPASEATLLVSAVLLLTTICLRFKEKKTVIKDLFLKRKQNSECFWHQHTLNTLVYTLYLCGYYIRGS